jgi:hypothetical protein
MPLADLQRMGLLADGPSTPGDLAAGLGLTSSAMTKVLDRLERAGGPGAASRRINPRVDVGVNPDSHPQADAPDGGLEAR